MATPIIAPSEASAKLRKGRKTSRAYSGLVLAAQRMEDFGFCENGNVMVPSRSRPGWLHTVDPDRGSCPCEDRQFGKHLCAHIYAADFALAFRQKAGEGVFYRIERGSWPGLEAPVYCVYEHRPEGFAFSEATPGGFVRQVRRCRRQCAHSVSYAGAVLEVIELMGEGLLSDEIIR